MMAANIIIIIQRIRWIAAVEGVLERVRVVCCQENVDFWKISQFEVFSVAVAVADVVLLLVLIRFILLNMIVVLLLLFSMIEAWCVTRINVPRNGDCPRILC